MKKKIEEMTFEEFSNWANMRACDGRWSFNDAVTCAELIRLVHNESSKFLFRKKKKREEIFNKYRPEYLKMDAEIELGE